MDTVYSFPWLLLLFFNFLALCCPFSLSPSPQALLICPLHCAWFGNCWSALCHRTWALELLWVKGMGFSTQTFIDCFDNTEAFCLFFTFLFCCAELRLTNMWLLVSEGMLKPLFSQQLATNLELLQLLFWNLEL